MRGWGVKAEVRQSPVSFSVQVWLYLPDPVTGRGHVLNLDGTIREEIKPGEDPPPSFEASEEVLKALVAAGAEHLPPDRAQAHHLSDAIAVRDRLLTLVEQNAGGTR